MQPAPDRRRELRFISFFTISDTPSQQKWPKLGVDLATLAAILGHSSIRVVEKYVHPTAEHKQQAMRKFEDSLFAKERQVAAQDGSRVI